MVQGLGVPTEATLAQMRAMGASYVVGSPGRYATPKGRLTRLEADYLAQPWSQVREGLMVKLKWSPVDGPLMDGLNQPLGGHYEVVPR